jgi:formiminotetrahydrofolate cyclodeaminase
MKKKQIKEIIKKVISEMSATGGGGAGASFSPGAGEQYATPFAFNPNKKAKGTAHNYYLKLGYKPVNKEQMRKQAKGMEYKDLWKENGNI